MFGDARVEIPATFVYLSDEDGDSHIAAANVTWYDARAQHKTRTEYRLYFGSNEVIDRAVTGDTLFVARTANAKLLILVAKADSTIEGQLCWLFGQRPTDRFDIQEDFPELDSELELTARNILLEIGLTPKEDEALREYLPAMVKLFKGQWPTVKEFASFARSTLNLDPSHDSVDKVIMHWMSREEGLYKVYEDYTLEKDANSHKGLSPSKLFDLVALPVFNRRKSRAGRTLEGHLSEIFESRGVMFAAQGITELKRRPDFIFPSIEAYHDPQFNSSRLTMLGVKRTCKDRWRQILTEAQRIPNKHLFTLEPKISESQTAEMRSSNLQLVVPASVQKTYTEAQQKWLMSLSEFIDLVKARQ